MPVGSSVQAVLGCVLVAVVLLAHGAHGQTAQGSWKTGRSTFYTDIDQGNCGFGVLSSTKFPYRYIAAANTAFYANSAACGQCFEVKCTGSAYLANACVNGSVVVEVTDQCPCDGNAQWCCGDAVHFDLSAGAFGKIAKTAAGVVTTQYRPVTCPVQGQLQVKIKDGSNPWWFALLATNVGGSGAVTKVEVRSSGTTGSWLEATRQDYNYWLATSGSGLQFPLGVRVWQGSVKNVMGTITSMSAGATFSLSANFA